MLFISINGIDFNFLGIIGNHMKIFSRHLPLTFWLLALPMTQISAEDEVSQNAAAVGVTSSKVEALAFYPSRNAPAQVQALNRSQIPAQIGAVVESLEKRVGDRFSAGEVLAKLDCKDKKLELSNQTAQYARLLENLEFERRQYVRGKQLAKQKTIGEAELDRLNTNVRIAESQFESQSAIKKSAEIGVERCQIIAPYKGVVVTRVANVGEMVAMGNPIVEVVELDNSEVSAFVALTDVESFNASNNFELVSNGNRYSLRNRVLLPVVNHTSRTREARLEFDSTASLVGVAGRLYWFSPFYHLPANLLQRRGDKVGVFVLDDNQAAFIETPTAQEGRPILLNDFEQWRGKLLIVDGRHGLVDGQRVSAEGITSRQPKKQTGSIKSGNN